MHITHFKFQTVETERCRGKILKNMEEKTDKAPSPPPSVIKPFVWGGVAGIFSGYFDGSIKYYMSSLDDVRFRKHPNYVRYCFNRNMIPGMALVDAFAFSQILGFYNIVRGAAVARNDCMRPSLYQEAASGLIAGAAAAYLSFPFAVVCQHKVAVSMGPIAQRWRLCKSKSVLQILRDGGPWLKKRAGLGMGMVAAYNPSFHYLMEFRGLSEKDAELGAAAISAFSAAACGQLAQHACSFSSVRQTLKSKGALGFFEGFSGLFSHNARKIMLFWVILKGLQQNLEPLIEA